MTLRAFKKSCIFVIFKNLGELWTTIKIREKLQLNEQISHPILFAVELTQSWQRVPPVKACHMAMTPICLIFWSTIDNVE